LTDFRPRRISHWSLWRQLRQADRIERRDAEIESLKAKVTALEEAAVLQDAAPAPTKNSAEQWLWKVAPWAAPLLATFAPSYFTDPDSSSARAATVLVGVGTLAIAAGIGLTVSARILWPLGVAAAVVFPSWAAVLVLSSIDAVSLLPDAWVVNARLAATLSVVFFGPLGVLALLRVAFTRVHRRFLLAFMLFVVFSMPLNSTIALAQHQAQLHNLENRTTPR
jgi:hypothetical protein